MKHPIPHNCPVCQSRITVRELHCDRCDTTVRGSFEASRLSSLTEEQLTFVETFIKVRGSMKEMERELKISYPTVRNRLEQVIEALGYEKKDATFNEMGIEGKSAQRASILSQLDRGEISYEEAMKKIQEL